MNQLEQIHSSISIDSSRQSESHLLSVIVNNQASNTRLNLFDSANNGDGKRDQNSNQQSLKELYEKLAKAEWSTCVENIRIGNKPVQFQSLKPATKYTTISDSEANSIDDSNSQNRMSDHQKSQQPRNANKFVEVHKQKVRPNNGIESRSKKQKHRQKSSKRRAKYNQSQRVKMNQVCLSSASDSSSPCKILLLKQISKNDRLQKELQRTMQENIQLRKVICSISTQTKEGQKFSQKGAAQRMKKKKTSKRIDSGAVINKNNGRSLQKLTSSLQNKVWLHGRKHQIFTTFVDQASKQNKLTTNFKTKGKVAHSKSTKMVSGGRDQTAIKRRLLTETR